MSFGFLISSVCNSQAVAMQLSIGSFYPCLLLSGILWPLEGMSHWLQTISQLLPNTLACQSMRNIMLRGWDVSEPEVYLGVRIRSLLKHPNSIISVLDRILTYLDQHILGSKLDSC